MELKNFMNSEQALKELQIERQAWKNASKAHRNEQIHLICSRMAKVDRNDPFAYDRAYTHLTNNISTPDDYRKRFKDVRPSWRT